jgi:hypothetical protein
MVWRGVIDRYREYLPIGPKAEIITLSEGNTPLVHATKISKEVASNLDVYLKYEGSHPTGSFKDRGMTVAVTKAVEEGCKATICASTGNTSASAAAFSARAGIKSIVIIPKGRIALGKRAQAMIYGAMVIEIEGNFDDALRIVIEIGEKYPVTIVNSINPYRLQGQKRPITTPSPSAMPATSPPTGWAIRSTGTPGRSRPSRSCSDFRRKGLLRLSGDTSLRTRKPSRPPSASAILPVGSRRKTRRRSPGV